MRRYTYLSRAKVRKYIPEMERRGVSQVSRARGFTRIYLAGENPKLLMVSKNLSWDQKRHNFIKRHMARGHALYDDRGRITRHHLALIAWAYSPSTKIRR